jgi:hypothetical protein
MHSSKFIFMHEHVVYPILIWNDVEKCHLFYCTMYIYMHTMQSSQWAQIPRLNTSKSLFGPVNVSIFI